MPENNPSNDNIAPMPAPTNVAPTVHHGYGDQAQQRAHEYVHGPVHYHDAATGNWLQRPPTDAEKAERSVKAKASTGFDGMQMPAGPTPAEQRIIDRQLMVGHDASAGPSTTYDIDMMHAPAKVREELGGRLSRAMGSLQLSKGVGSFIAEDIVRSASATIGMDELAQTKWQAEQGALAAQMLGRHGIEYHAAQKAVQGMLESARVEASVATFLKTSAVAFFRLAMLAKDRGLIK